MNERKPKTKKFRVKLTFEYTVWTTHTRMSTKGAAKLIKRRIKQSRCSSKNGIVINNQYDWTQYDIKKITT